MKELKKAKYLDIVGSMTEDQTRVAIDLWLNELVSDPSLSVNTKVVGDLDFEELIMVLQNCKRHLKGLS